MSIISNNLKDLKNAVLDLVLHTKIEIVAVGLVLGGASSKIIYDHYKELGAKNPVAFSEEERITRHFNKLGQDVPPLTAYYSAINNVPMKVLEAANNGYDYRGGDLEGFASELEPTVDPGLRIHKQLSEYSAQINQLAGDALHATKDLLAAERDLVVVAKAFDKAWDDDHDDVYHTEFYDVEDCTTDSEGNQDCVTRTETREVYDYTIHTYDYDEKYGAAANRLLADFVSKYPELNIEEELYTAKMTGADNEYAIDRSLELKTGVSSREPNEYLAIVNHWAHGSNLAKYRPQINAAYSNLKVKNSQWGKAWRTAQSDRYTTYSHSDSGPKEFQIAEAAFSYARSIVRNSKNITTGIKFSKKAVPEIERLSREFIAVTLDGKDGDANQIKSDLMELSRELYDKNIEDGLELDPNEWGKAILFGLLATLASIGAGAGVDFAIDNNRTIRSKVEDMIDDDHHHFNHS